ncbi:MAG: dTDP-4-dehydrorhamnose reductase [Deltaproteobacteria bacterium]|jgi:dTDP-4-dehydrorhamnose reductase|nr:dTDP-4-dehydrorhamnose reductase [Deltaproteobacteria bacterium]
MILLIGKDGQLGRNLALTLAPLGPITLWGRNDADLASPDLAKRLDALKHTPNIIVNAAAYTDVDRAENDERCADIVNHLAVKTIAEFALSKGALFIHYSTDYVHDGRKKDFYLEEDTPNPLNVYGQTKLQGEMAIAEVMGEKGDYLIFRTSWVYSLVGKNFLKTVLHLAHTHVLLSMDNTQHGSPTSAEYLASATANVVKDRLDGKEGLERGLYNLAASGETTWYEYAIWIVEKAESLGFTLKLKPEGIVIPNETGKLQTAARPNNSRLSTIKYQRQTHLIPPHWSYYAELILGNLSSFKPVL